jgi:RHS repeat-associated protein
MQSLRESNLNLLDSDFRYYDPTTGRFTIQDSVTGTQEDPMSLNRYIYARDNPMKIVDLAGHEWYNPISDITSAASSTVSDLANAVTTGVSDVAGAAASAWNSIPPVGQDAIMIGGAVALTVATGGAAAPTLLAVGAAVGGATTTAYVASTVSSGGTITTEGLEDGMRVKIGDVWVEEEGIVKFVDGKWRATIVAGTFRQLDYKGP